MSTSAAKKIILLGSTGSIGTSTISVAKALPQELEIIGLAAGTRADKLAQQAIETGAKQVCIHDTSQYKLLKSLLPSDVTVYAGSEGLIELATAKEADMVLIAIAGTAGLEPALHAIQHNKDLAIASKEILVMAGEIIMQKAAEQGVSILPVDSEHNAIFQCLTDSRPTDEISRIILTASGGPFRNTPAEDLATVTLEQALAHPTWEMGRKITIDSATLFNKGLEMIEAMHLFKLPMDKIDVIVHPQSIIHSMVEYIDGSVLAQMNSADMSLPIQYAITYPRRVKGNVKPLNFAELCRLDFEEPRYNDFPALSIARNAGTEGGVYPAVMNAANEVAVEAFCQQKLDFPSIWKIVERTLAVIPNSCAKDLENIIDADSEARKIASSFI